MNSYISLRTAKKRGFYLNVKPSEIEEWEDDAVKGKVISAIIDGSWKDKFDYDKILKGDASSSASDLGFTFNDFFADETFVMFASYASVKDWKLYLDVRLAKFAEVVDCVETGDIEKSYYILRYSMINFLVSYCSYDKIAEFVSREIVQKDRDVNFHVRHFLYVRFKKCLMNFRYESFLEFLHLLIKRKYIRSIPMYTDVDNLFRTTDRVAYKEYRSWLKGNY